MYIYVYIIYMYIYKLLKLALTAQALCNSVLFGLETGGP